MLCGGRAPHRGQEGTVCEDLLSGPMCTHGGLYVEYHVLRKTKAWLHLGEAAVIGLSILCSALTVWALADEDLEHLLPEPTGPLRT